MTWTTYPYCTLAQVKNVLGLPSTDTDDDAWISNDLIPQAQSFIDRYIGYSFQQNGTTASPITNVYDGGDGAKLVIDYCQSFSQILETTYNVVLGADGIFSIQTTKTIDITADCKLGPTSALNGVAPFGYTLQRVSQLPFVAGTQNYAVTGVWGRPIIPAEITRVCSRITAHYYKMRDTNYADTISEQNSVRMRYSKELSKDIIEILEQYRRRRFMSGTFQSNTFVG